MSEYLIPLNYYGEEVKKESEIESEHTLAEKLELDRLAQKLGYVSMRSLMEERGEEWD